MRKIAMIGVAGLFLTACEHYGHDRSEAADKISVDAAVTISKNSSGGYAFAYNAPFFDEKGNFDFSQEGANDHIVNMTFKIADGSVDGVKFRSDPHDAIWIVEKKDVDPNTGSPSGPYRGQQFYNFSVSEDGQTLTLTDANNDGVLYRYGLRFDLDGGLIIDDPDGQNGPRD